MTRRGRVRDASTPVVETLERRMLLASGAGDSKPVSDDDGCPTAAEAPMFSKNPVRYFDGVAKNVVTDLSSDGFGGTWGHTRTWTNRTARSYNDVLPQDNGRNWTVSQLPWLHEQVGGNTSTVIAIDGGAKQRYYDSKDGGPYVGRDKLKSRFEKVTLPDGSFEGRIIAANGSVTRYHDPASADASLKGRLKGRTDAAGNVTEVVSRDADGRPTRVERANAANTSAEFWDYAYLPAGDPNAGRISQVTLSRQSNGGTVTVVRSAEYAYYASDAEFGGNRGDLKLAVVRDDAGQTVDTKYYRYYKQGEAGGYKHALKYMFEPEAYRRLAAAVAGVGANPLTASDAAVAPYATRHFTYTTFQRVASETVTGGGACCGGTGGLGTFGFTYSTNSDFIDDPLVTQYNDWKYKTIETLSDGTRHLVYANEAGQPMLFIVHDAAASQWHRTYYRYDAQGRLLLKANPSAVSGHDKETRTLVGDGSNALHLRDNAGLIETFSYYGAGETGGAVGELKEEAIRRGELGASVPQRRLTYEVRTTPSGAFRNVIASDTEYRHLGEQWAQTTTYQYAWLGDTAEIAQRSTTHPVVPTVRNGPGTADTEQVAYDTYGRRIRTRDADGFLTHTAYDDGTGAVVKTIVDVDTSQTSTFSGLPAGWSTPAGGGLHLTTARVVDGLGRTVKTVSPAGRTTHVVYDDTSEDGDVREVRVYTAWQENGGVGTVVGPVSVTRWSDDAAFMERLTYSAASYPADANGGRRGRRRSPTCTAFPASTPTPPGR